jgi:hypothetical protein
MSAQDFHSTIRVARDQSLENLGINAAERKVLLNLETEEVDSLAELIVRLPGHGVPRQMVTRMLGLLVRALDLNVQEANGEHRVTGLLDQLTTPAQRRAMSKDLGIKSLARTLRPALKVIADMASPDAATLIAAAGTVSRVIATTPPQTLRSSSLRNELRASAHDLLLSLMEEEGARA